MKIIHMNRSIFCANGIKCTKSAYCCHSSFYFLFDNKRSSCECRLEQWNCIKFNWKLRRQNCHVVLKKSTKSKYEVKLFSLSSVRLVCECLSVHFCQLLETNMMYSRVLRHSIENNPFQLKKPTWNEVLKFQPHSRHTCIRCLLFNKIGYIFRNLFPFFLLFLSFAHCSFCNLNFAKVTNDK